MENLLKVQEGTAPEWFARIGDELMREWRLIIHGEEFVLTEIEFYLHSAEHPDPYVHRTPTQLTCGQWYFHREAAAKRSFTLKGLDLTFGPLNTTHGGILIRALRRDQEPIIEGPSKTVDAILDACEAKSVADLRALAGFSVRAFDAGNPWLHLRRAEASIGGRIKTAGRFGLSDKKGPNLYLAAPYRYRLWPELAKKARKELLAGADLVRPADAQKLTDEDIAEILEWF